MDIDLFDTDGTRIDLNTRTDANGDHEIGPMVLRGCLLRVDPTIVEGYRGRLPRAISS